MKRRRNITHLEHAATTYKVCPVCKKFKPEQVGVWSSDGRRWYCSALCARRGEHKYRGND